MLLPGASCYRRAYQLSGSVLHCVEHFAHSMILIQALLVPFELISEIHDNEPFQMFSVLMASCVSHHDSADQHLRLARKLLNLA